MELLDPPPDVDVALETDTVAALTAHVGWDQDAVCSALRGWRVQLNPHANAEGWWWDRDWDTGEPVKRDGSSGFLNRLILIGSWERGRSALPHEMAHVAQGRIDKTVQYKHEDWSALGIWAALDEVLNAPR